LDGTGGIKCTDPNKNLIGINILHVRIFLRNACIFRHVFYICGLSACGKYTFIAGVIQSEYLVLF
jgi:hypothetical protein